MRNNTERVREHLANERTYLSWMRTAIALMGFSFVIMRLRYSHNSQLRHPGNGWELSLFFSLSSLSIVILTTQHYFAVRHAINSDMREASSRWVLLLSLFVTILGSGVIYLSFL
ncbi:MAG: DUF202 domain-containing protein [Chroococcidiopsidaceae cyanobacterium CP_BM_RX_35]|nr:DUF202 domain-containing protein [Chroococcidiopsidaceae cyanobacterium CP_BM_RX_35]